MGHIIPFECISYDIYFIEISMLVESLGCLYVDLASSLTSPQYFFLGPTQIEQTVSY
ncbi:UNVERIFIED_CONTAM: hypothetical protein GTU68_001961 [Idotea baltica]|nr:hypothetical protein [Idotea baltica]